MNTNIGSIDRIVRIGLAIIIAILYFTNVISGIFALVLLIVMGILVFTSFYSFCPIYYPFGISTKKKTNVKSTNEN